MWLLAAAVRQAIEQAQSNGVVPNVEQQAQYEARYGYEEGGTPRILTVAGDTDDADNLALVNDERDVVECGNPSVVASREVCHREDFISACALLVPQLFFTGSVVLKHHLG